MKVLNAFPKLLPTSLLLTIPQSAVVALVFDTDVPLTEYLKNNLARLKRCCAKVRIVTLALVHTPEDEQARSTEVKTSLTNEKRKVC